MEFFGKKMMNLGVGGSIPFIAELGDFYPNSEFLVTGVVTNGSNIHAPDENLNLPYCKNLLVTIANIVIDYK